MGKSASSIYHLMGGLRMYLCPKDGIVDTELKVQDFENLAAGSDLIATNSNGKRPAKKLGIPIYRLGFPILDRLGNGHRSVVGYRGTMELLFELGNIWLDAEESAHPNILVKQGES